MADALDQQHSLYKTFKYDWGNIDYTISLSPRPTTKLLTTLKASVVYLFRSPVYVVSSKIMIHVGVAWPYHSESLWVWVKGRCLWEDVRNFSYPGRHGHVPDNIRMFHVKLTVITYELNLSSLRTVRTLKVGINS